MNISKRHSAVRAIVLNGNKLLAMKRNKFGMHYHTLIGGGVDVGEDLETALRRELREETGLSVGQVRLAFLEDGGDLYGIQNVFLCEYQGGDPVLSPDSEEAKITALGQNTYEPVWLPVSELGNVTFRSVSVRDAILAGTQDGWPAEPRMLDWKA